MNELKDRFDQVKRGLKIGYKEAGAIIDMSDNAFKMALNRNSLKRLQIAELEKKLGIREGWLETGEGPMLTTEDQSSSIDIAGIQITQNRQSEIDKLLS